MSEWNFDMIAAPRSDYVTEKRQIGKAIKDVKTLAKKYVIATDGEIVTRSYYIPDDDRWCMFATGQELVAWQPWPEPPK